jgi:hypothetical protein
MDRSDILMALVLRCPRRERLCLFLARQTYDLNAHDPLLFHQVLGNESVQHLLAHLATERSSGVVWHSVVFDQLDRTLRFSNQRWQSATRWQKLGILLGHPVGLVLAAAILFFLVALVAELSR